MPEAAAEIRPGEISLAGQHVRNRSGGYDPVTTLPQMVATSTTNDGARVEVILDCDYVQPEPTPENPDPEPEQMGRLELRFFLVDDDGENLPPVCVRLSTDLLPALASGIVEAKKVAASRFDFLDNLHANR